MKKKLIYFLTFALFALSTSVLFSANTAKPDDVVGMWFSKDKSRGSSIVKIYKAKDKYLGKIIWITNPLDDKGNYQLDVNNPDPKLKKNPIIGLLIIKDFTFKDGKWKDGTVYDPENGKTYNATMWLSDNNETLDLRGYIGISLLGKTEQWKRLH